MPIRASVGKMISESPGQMRKSLLPRESRTFTIRKKIENSQGTREASWLLVGRAQLQEWKIQNEEDQLARRVLIYCTRTGGKLRGVFLTGMTTLEQQWIH